MDESNFDNTQNDGVVDENADNTAPQQRIIGKPWPKGVSGNPKGRPKGSISIKDTIRKMFEEDPERFKQFVDTLIADEKSLVWQMLEGKPLQKLAGDEENPLRIITVDKDLANIHDITSSSTKDDSEGQE